MNNINYYKNLNIKYCFSLNCDIIYGIEIIIRYLIIDIK